jgi:hypothetical protein
MEYCMPSTRLPVLKTVRTRMSRTALFFVGIGLFDVLVWTAAAIAN